MNHLEFSGSNSASTSGAISGTKSKPVTVFLHGFPAVRSIQNRDIAEKTAKATGRHVYLPLYRGLGFSEGEFSFRQCRADVHGFVDDLIQKHGRIDLVGHSWGGYLSLGLAAKHGSKIGRLVLMSPLLNFFNVDIADESFKGTAKENPQLNLGKIEDRSREFVEVGTETPANGLAAKIDVLTEVIVLQAAADQVTPAKYAETLLDSFKKRPHYETVDTDHSFLVKREEASNKVIQALNELLISGTD